MKYHRIMTPRSKWGTKRVKIERIDIEKLRGIKAGTRIPAGEYTIEQLKDYIEEEFIVDSSEELVRLMVTSIPTGAGLVSGAGDYKKGTTVNVSAKPVNSDYYFVGWSNGATRADTSITLTGDSTLAARFGEYPKWADISVIAQPGEGGTTYGSGRYSIGERVSIGVTPAPYWNFIKWTDGNTSPTREVVASRDRSFTAILNRPEYTITALATNGGSTTGSGTYFAGEEVTLLAIPADGYQFDGWSNGEENPELKFIAESDLEITANFSLIPIPRGEIILKANIPEAVEWWRGDGSYPIGVAIEIEAHPNPGYKFIEWDHGYTDNPHTLVVEQSYDIWTAIFEQEPVTITADSSPSGTAEIDGTGTYLTGETAVLTVTPAPGYTFTSWDDGNRDNPRTITVSPTKTHYVAKTGRQTYTIKLDVNAPNYVEVTGIRHSDQHESWIDNFLYGTELNIRVAVKDGWKFSGMNPSKRYHDYSFTVTENKFLSVFVEEIVNFLITVKGEPDYAVADIQGGGYGMKDDQMTFEVVPNTGWRFSHWKEDGDTENPRTITVKREATYTAILEEAPALCNVVAEPKPGQWELGTCTGTGMYPTPSDVTIRAIPNPGYVFVKWDGAMASFTGQDPERSIPALRANPFTFTTFDYDKFEFRANFALDDGTYKKISVNATPSAAAADIRGNGAYLVGEEDVLYVKPAPGYKFVSWNDGNTDNPRILSVTEDASYTATFTPVTGVYIEVGAFWDQAGVAYGTGTYPVGTTVTMGAIAHEGYYVAHLDDSSGHAVSNPYTFTVQDTPGSNLGGWAWFWHYPDEYNIGLFCNIPEAVESYTGSGSYAPNSWTTIGVNLKPGYRFVDWDDGSTYNPRTVQVLDNHNYIANVVSSVVGTADVYIEGTEGGGTFTDVTGTYNVGDKLPLEAFPNPGWEFEQFYYYVEEGRYSGALTYNPAELEITEPGSWEIVVTFRRQEGAGCVVDVTSDVGTTYGSGGYQNGTPVTIGANVPVGYKFERWIVDESIETSITDNPYTFTVHDNEIYRYKAKLVPVELTNPKTLDVFIDNPSFIEGNISGVKINGAEYTDFNNEIYWIDKQRPSIQVRVEGGTNVVVEPISTAEHWQWSYNTIETNSWGTSSYGTSSTTTGQFKDKPITIYMNENKMITVAVTDY